MSLISFINSRSTTQPQQQPHIQPPNKLAALLVSKPPAPVNRAPVPSILLTDQAQFLAKQQEDEQKQHDKQRRTIFVGNLSLDTTKKDLVKAFKPFGDIEKVRFRSVPLQINKLSKKANFILGHIDKQGDCMHAYLTFITQQAARKARLQHPRVLKEKHIRVTMELEKLQDYETTAFIGNLPYTVKEETLWQLFAPCGDIRTIRVVKNQDHQGIGIAFVQAADKATLTKIREYDGSWLQDRQLRIKKATTKNRMQKKQRGKAERLQQRLQSWRNPEAEQND